MDSHALALLDFDTILNEIKGCCMSEGGVRALDKQEILTKQERVAELLNASVSFREMMEARGDFPDLTFPDIEGCLKPLSKTGSVLESVELAGIGVYAGSSSRLKKYLEKNNQNPLVSKRVEEIADLSDLSKAILSIIREDGEIEDEKIPGLSACKKKIQGLKKNVERIVGSLANDPVYKQYLQSDLPTIKDGRSVLPVKTAHKGKIKGVVHEISSTGATVFLEPLEVVEINNEIVKAEGEYKREIFRVLRELTQKASGRYHEIAGMIEGVSFIDTLYARARYAIRHRCVRAGYDPARLVLVNARHPLIGEKLVVPVSLCLSDNIRVLIITGPNTGGKTVTLKTTGILLLMNQFGMEIPADPGSTLPVIDNVFADIGDEQSLEQSLSTFSSHMVNIGKIVKKSTRSSLVVLDELGAGTDPEEGVAIAMSLLDHFIDKGCFVLSTTHHGILKNYGYSRQHVENASMEFDTETLTPRFRLLMGVPGASYAIIVAEKNGIPAGIIEKAKNYLEDERTDISELIKKLSEKHSELVHAERKQALQEKELLERERKTDLKELKLKQKEHELRSFHLREIKEFLHESKKKLEALARDLREGEVSRDKLAGFRGFVSSISEKVSAEEAVIEKQYEELIAGARVELEPGMEVIVKASGMKGKILRKGKSGTWIVETETLKVSLRPDELTPCEEEASDTKIKISSVSGNVEEAVYQLDVRGLRLEEAIRRVERQIDRALVSGLGEFSIVHGMGDGILQRGIHEYLKTQRIVKDYFFSLPEHGGFGRTIVVLSK